MDNKYLYNQLDAKAKEWVNRQVKGINTELKAWLLLVLLAVLIPGLLMFIRPAEESVAEWFSRSGSVIVVFGLLAEIKVSALEKLAAYHENSFLYCNQYISEKYRTKIIIFKAITIAIIIVGTFCWGYGDLPFSHLLQQLIKS